MNGGTRLTGKKRTLMLNGPGLNENENPPSHGGSVNVRIGSA
jgi:hypothetical protein